MYGDASGYLGLREAIADKLARWEGVEVSPDELAPKYALELIYRLKAMLAKDG